MSDSREPLPGEKKWRSERKPPKPYPDGDPCMVFAHPVWCRCEKPDVSTKDDREQFERLKKRNEELRAGKT